MSGLRLYVHDAHGRMIAGDLRVQKSARARRCEGYRHDGRLIMPGETYAIATLYPSDDDFNYLDRETLKPSKSAARLHLCIDCLGDSARDLLAVHDVGSNAHSEPDVSEEER